MKRRNGINLVVIVAILLTVFLFLEPGKKKVNRAFYFWENNTTFYSDSCKNALEELHIEKLYVKFFEIEKHPSLGIIPSAKSKLSLNSLSDSMEIIPCVYIRNEVFKNTQKKEVVELVDNYLFLIKKHWTENVSESKKIKELQVDCDWTESTKDNYHFFINELNQKLDKDTFFVRTLVSATLRLYAYKFPDKMGFLKTDKAILMCYNLLNPLETNTKNSILDLTELKKYLEGAKAYPIALDVALPIYSSVQVYQNNRFRGMIYNDTEAYIQSLLPVKHNWFRVKKDTLMEQLFLRQGDYVKVEKVSEETIQKAIKCIKKNVLLNKNYTVSFFHLNDYELKNYSHEKLDAFYSSFLR